MYEYVILRAKSPIEGDLISCPTEEIADMLLNESTNFLTVKMHRQELR